MNVINLSNLVFLDKMWIIAGDLVYALPTMMPGGLRTGPKMIGVRCSSAAPMIL